MLTTTTDVTPGAAGRRPDRYRANLRALTAAQKPTRGTAAYSRWVNRPLARRVAAAGGVVGLTPNRATAVSATMSATGLALVALVEPSWALGVAVAALLALGYVMDSVDGQLARLAGRGTLSGEWLDHTVDCAKTCLLHLVVLVSWFRWPPVDGDAALLLPMVFLVVDISYFFSVILMPFLRGKGGAGAAAAAAPPREHPLRQWLILPTDYGLFCWMFVLLGSPVLFALGYGLMFLTNTALLGLGFRKWWRELRALDRQEA